MPKTPWGIVQQTDEGLLEYIAPVTRYNHPYARRGWQFWIPAWVEAILQQYHGRFERLKIRVTEDGKLVIEPLRADDQPPVSYKRMRIFHENDRLLIVVGE